MKLSELLQNLPNRKIKAMFFAWFFINTSILLYGYLIRGWIIFPSYMDGYDRHFFIERIYPFNFYIRFYDITEYFMYVIMPTIFYVIYKYYKSEDKSI